MVSNKTWRNLLATNSVKTIWNLLNFESGFVPHVDVSGVYLGEWLLINSDKNVILGVFLLSARQRTQCISWYHKNWSTTQAHCSYRTTYAELPRAKYSVLRWAQNFEKHWRTANAQALRKTRSIVRSKRKRLLLHWSIPKQIFTKSRTRFRNVTELNSWYTQKKEYTFSVQTSSRTPTGLRLSSPMVKAEAVLQKCQNP